MSGRRLNALCILALAVSLVSGACGGDPPAGPTPPPAPQLSVVCPPAQSGVSFQGQPAAISWPAPTPQGGTPPIQTSCTPASGAAFLPGVTAVSCAATDSANQAASCAFTVTITRPPQISVTRFMAFGDSITWGTASPPAGFLAYPIPAPSYSYPTQLLVLLGTRYPDQAITMANEGWPGEAVADGLNRLPSALAVNTPEVLLLLDGANDLLGNPSSATTQYIATKLRDMVRTAKARMPTIKVLLATFPPQYHGTIPYDRGAGAEYVPELNQRIAGVSQSEGATLVDLYAAFPVGGKPYIGVDGLHPTEQGYTLMAQTFGKIIQEKFEAKATAGR
jgi:lysophospholipase L1-like esterase